MSMLNVFYRISFGLAVFLVVFRGLLGDEKVHLLVRDRLPFANVGKKPDNAK